MVNYYIKLVTSFRTHNISNIEKISIFLKTVMFDDDEKCLTKYKTYKMSKKLCPFFIQGIPI